MVHFSGSRTPGEFFGAGRSQYIEARLKETGVLQGWLCHCMDKASGELTGQPWATLVVGSGCLEALDAPDRAAIYGLEESVVQHLRRHPDADLWFDGDADPAIRRFVQYLVRDRIDPDDRPRGAPTKPHEVEEQAADLVILAALLTRLYHRMKSFDITALTRSGNEVAVMRTTSAWWPELFETLALPAVRLGEQITGALGARQVDSLVKRVLRVVRLAINAMSPVDVPVQLAMWHITLLTECAWYFVTKDTSVYPGWGDLLLTLAVERPVSIGDDLAAEGEFPARMGLPRPAFGNPQQAAEAVRTLFLPTTMISWERDRSSALESERTRLYTTCANLLRAQARARANDKSTDLPPVASAFVTTFDLELEMALLRSPNSSPFLVVIPFQVLFDLGGNRTDSPSHPIWLCHVVRPDVDGLDELLDPSEWFVLTQTLLNATQAIAAKRGDEKPGLNHEDLDLRFGNLPVVVRLSGSPLVQPPELWDDGAPPIPLLTEVIGSLGQMVPKQFKEVDTLRPGAVKLEHAIVLDEYAAMQQTATELFNPGPSGRLGLPLVLSGRTPTHARFWTLLGVQVGDAGMRHRVAFQISSPALTGQQSLKQAVRAGLVVNRRLSSEDQELLHWFGFDVVQGRSQDFIDDLDRLVEHYRHGTWHGSDETCNAFQ